MNNPPGTHLSPNSSRLKWLWRMSVAGCLAMMFLGTHLPIRDLPVDPGSSDKTLHLVGYFLFGCVVGLWPVPHWRGWFATLLTVYAWAAFDELTQPLVGRTGDLNDWFSDVTGVTTGFTLMCGFHRLIKWSARNGHDCHAPRS